MATEAPDSLNRRHLSQEQFEEAFARAQEIDERRKRELQQRAANRSRARKIAQSERSGKVRFSVLAVALTLTTIIVIVVMFETLALLVGG